MATKPSSGLRFKLEERLTCPVCLDHYTNPKILPCHHSFCQQCLERLPLDKKNETYYLSCPTCRHRTEVPPEKGVGALPVAFHINDLKEMYSLTKKTVDLSVSQEATCSDHGKPLELFCETCGTVICVTCQVRIHKHHEYDLISDSYTKHCQKLRECLSPVEKKKKALKKVLSALAEREGEIRERGEGVLEEIHEMVEEMIAVLRESEKKLTEQAKRVTDDKLKVLSEQMKSAEMSLSLLEDVEDYVGQSLKTGSPQQVLRSKEQMMERMSEVTARINVEELHPKEKGDFVLSKDIKSLGHIGDIVTYSSIVPQQLPHQQAHQQPQWHQAHHPHYNQQQQYPWQQMEKYGAYSYGKAGTTSATSFQATHPHVPKSSLHGDKICIVCDQPIYHRNQCHLFGPDKVLVHKECYSCIKCKGKRQLKLYFGWFVCIDHINQITCKNCHKKGQMKFNGEVCFCTCQEKI